VARAGCARAMVILDRHGLAGPRAVAQAWRILGVEGLDKRRDLIDVCHRAQVGEIVSVLATLERIANVDERHGNDVDPSALAACVADALADRRKLESIAMVFAIGAFMLGALILMVLPWLALLLIRAVVGGQRANEFGIVGTAVALVALAVLMAAVRHTCAAPVPRA